MESSIKLLPEPIAWVQCDDKKCLKWRKVPKKMISTIENTPWFCHMNPDKDHAYCSAKQEEMKVPKGETVVFSLLEEGSLVWAKVCGYPRWPSIICSDIVEDNFASFDDWGDVTHYHVEYFGDPRSHSWVLARDVEIYGSGNAPVPFLLTSHKGMKTIQSRKSFQRAVMQADKLTLLQPKERLKHCFFQPNKSSDVLNEEKGFLSGNSQEFKATQKKVPQKDEKMHKSEPLSSYERSALVSRCANESTQKRRRRKKCELDSISVESKLDMNGDGEAKRRRKVVKNDCFQCCSAPNSSNVNAECTASTLFTKESMANNSRYVGVISSNPCTSITSRSASSLSGKLQQNASKNMKQKGVCLLNINGVVVPAMLPTSKSNSNASSQENICDTKIYSKNESVCGFSTILSYQNKEKLNNKQTRILDAGVQSSIMQHAEKEATCAAKQIASQDGCPSTQENNPYSSEHKEKISSVKLPKMTLYKININKLSESKKPGADLQLSSLPVPFILHESATPPIDMGFNSQRTEKINKDVLSGFVRLNSVKRESEDLSNQISSANPSLGQAERRLKQESAASILTKSGKQDMSPNGTQLTEKSPRTFRSFLGKSFPANAAGPEEERVLNQVQMSSSSKNLQTITSSHPSKLLDEAKAAASFKALFTQYADIKKLEESERCIKYNGEALDLCSLYLSVQNSGGFDKANRDECWKSICKKTTGEERPSTIHRLKEIYERTLLPFDEYLQSLTITQYEKYSQEYEEAKACQPEGNLAKKDEMQKNTQEYNEYESSQQKIGNRDESIQKDKSLAQGGSIAKGDEEEDILYTLMDSKAYSPKRERDSKSTDYEETLDVMEVLERLQTAITDAELSLYHEDGLSSVENKTGGFSSEQKLQYNNTTDAEPDSLFEELDALEESIAEYSSILEMS